MLRRVLIVCLLIGTASACSDDKNSSVASSPGAAVSPDGSTAIGEAIAPPTTQMPDCSLMPPALELSRLVGIPLDEGRVTGGATCEYVGLNDQSRVVVLSRYTDPEDQASFLDLQTSEGLAAPLNDPDLLGATVGGSSAVYVTVDNAIYAVRTAVTDATVAEQVPLSAAVLKFWLTL